MSAVDGNNLSGQQPSTNVGSTAASANSAAAAQPKAPSAELSASDKTMLDLAQRFLKRPEAQLDPVAKNYVNAKHITTTPEGNVEFDTKIAAKNVLPYLAEAEKKCQAKENLQQAASQADKKEIFASTFPPALKEIGEMKKLYDAFSELLVSSKKYSQDSVNQYCRDFQQICIQQKKLANIIEQFVDKFGGKPNFTDLDNRLLTALRESFLPMLTQPEPPIPPKLSSNEEASKGAAIRNRILNDITTMHSNAIHHKNAKIAEANKVVTDSEKEMLTRHLSEGIVKSILTHNANATKVNFSEEEIESVASTANQYMPEETEMVLKNITEHNKKNPENRIYTQKEIDTIVGIIKERMLKLKNIHDFSNAIVYIIGNIYKQVPGSNDDQVLKKILSDAFAATNKIIGGMVEARKKNLI